jgi:hypothetical protein
MERGDGNYSLYIETYTPSSAEDNRKSFEILELAKNYKSQLESLSPLDLETLYKREKIIEQEERGAEDESLFFNQPEANTNYKIWSTIESFTIEEIISLSLGKDPEIVNMNSLSHISNQSPFYKTYLDRKIRLKKLAKRKKISFPCPLEIALDLLELLDIPFSEEAKEIMTQKNVAYREKLNREVRLENELLDLKREIEELKSKKMHPKMQESLLKMIAGMAVGAYSAKPERLSRNTLAREITEDMAKVGLRLDEDTIRKYITMSYELIPSEFRNSSNSKN